jgi:hypothetical protein
VNQRLVHDAAVAMAHALLDLVVPLLREEEKLTAFNEFYVVCKAGIDAYELQVDRMHKRLNPTRN